MLPSGDVNLVYERQAITNFIIGLYDLIKLKDNNYKFAPDLALNALTKRVPLRWVKIIDRS